MSQVANALTARIAAAKRRLLAGGLLRAVEWGFPVGERDIRGRQTYEYLPLHVLIEKRPAVDFGRYSTELNDNTVVTILEPLAVKDVHRFRWGDPLHSYSIKAIDGVVQNEEDGTRFFSEVTVIR